MRSAVRRTKASVKYLHAVHNPSAALALQVACCGLSVQGAISAAHLFMLSGASADHHAHHCPLLSIRQRAHSQNRVIPILDNSTIQHPCRLFSPAFCPHEMTKGIVETYTKASPVLEMEQSSEPLESNQPNSWACSKFPCPVTYRQRCDGPQSRDINRGSSHDLASSVRRGLLVTRYPNPCDRG